MKNFKLLVSAIALTLTLTISAQNGPEKRALEMVKEMKTKLDTQEGTNLTAEQEVKLKDIYIKKLEEIKVLKKEVTDEVVLKEKMKELNKKYSKEINTTVLNEQQKTYLKNMNQQKKAE